MQPWREYQEDAAAYFRELGLQATTDAVITGARNSHRVDVLVQSHYVGFAILWVVECKLWQSRVGKAEVLTLRGVVSDVGADRGILLSESGFQRGAVEAANLTNVQCTSMEDLRIAASSSFAAMHVQELYDRMRSCEERYWDIPKSERIAAGLRPAVGSGAYSGLG